jgi:hypothetical protein
MLLNVFLFISLIQIYMIKLFAYEFKISQEECMK